MKSLLLVKMLDTSLGTPEAVVPVWNEFNGMRKMNLISTLREAEKRWREGIQKAPACPPSPFPLRAVLPTPFPYLDYNPISLLSA